MVAEYLVREGVPYAVGIPGHGCVGLVDAFKERADSLGVIQVRHEQSACHLADGYYRASGKPLLAFTSIGPGAANTVIGVATAFVDSTALVLVTGETHTYMFGTGVLQEVERHHWADFQSVMRPITKRSWLLTRVDQVAKVIEQAFRTAVSGRPGPVHIAMPMDVQAESAEVETPQPSRPLHAVRLRGDSQAVAEAAKLLVKAERPLILVGGGVIVSGASGALVALAEFLGAPVITTLMGKGAIPEDHPLCAFYAGSKGSTVGNELAREADVLLAVGCRFADLSTSSYRPNASFRIPPTKLIHVDIDPYELGKNYPVTVGIVGDAGAVLDELLNAVAAVAQRRPYRETAYFRELQRLRAEWLKAVERLQASEASPMTTSRFLKELRAFLPRDAVVVGAAGHAQVQLFQEFPVYEPRTHVSSGGFSTMGWSLPAAIGVKLALPSRMVAVVCGDGDFQMCSKELATAVQYNVPIVCCVLNNYGWLSIRDLQIDVYGKERVYATEFRLKTTGERYNPDFVKLAEAYGCHASRVEKPTEVKDAVREAFDSRKTSVLEIMTAFEHPRSEGLTTGYWDVPIPTYLRSRRPS
ncbi:MAG: thiamine pyrophosphate-binding protein [Candidatus Bathyarchaeia archaeon]